MANRTNYEINGNKYWRIKRVIGHSPDGKPIHKYFYGVNRKDALNKYDEWKNEKDNIYTNNDVPFSDLADYYAENVLSINSSYTQNTIDKYLYHYNRFVRGKFNPLVSEIKPMTIQKFYNSLDVTYSTMSAIHKFMRGFFKWAEQNSYCPDFSRSVLLPDKPGCPGFEPLMVYQFQRFQRFIPTLGAVFYPLFATSNLTLEFPRVPSCSLKKVLKKC